MKKILIFDLETNGFVGSSVLQFSGLKYSYEDGIFKKDGGMNAYYLPKEGEKWNDGAYNVHKIELDFIKKYTKKRFNKLLTEYKEEIDADITLKEAIERTKFFKDDAFISDFLEDVDVFIGHNIKSFDLKFMDMHINKNKDYTIFDTMLLTIEELKLPYNGKNRYKSPKLQEACEYYGIEYDNQKAHNSKYDVMVNAKLFFRMLEDDKFLTIFEEGL